MIKLSEIETKYGDYLVDEDKLKELLIEPKPKTVYDLKKGDGYFYLFNTGTIENAVWSCHQIDYDRLLVGNVFLTEEDAKFAYERLWVIAELKKYAKEFSDEEWDDCTLSKYSIRYDFRICRVGVVMSFSVTGTELYFESEEKAQEAIKAVGEERVKKYYLGIGK